MLFFELGDSGENLGKAYRIGIEHRAAAPGREAVAIDVSDINIDSTLGDAFCQNTRAFVDQAVDTAFYDFFIRNGAAFNADTFDQSGGFWIG